MVNQNLNQNNMEKQTAVEWLYNNLKSHFEHDGDLLEVVQFSFKKSKQMEKEQIEEAYNQGWLQSNIEYLPKRSRKIFSDSEQYYQETFKNK
jgi:hypothetical protein